MLAGCAVGRFAREPAADSAAVVVVGRAEACAEFLFLARADRGLPDEAAERDVGERQRRVQVNRDGEGLTESGDGHRVADMGVGTACDEGWGRIGGEGCAAAFEGHRGGAPDAECARGQCDRDGY
jgi:hypothetical protein